MTLQYGVYGAERTYVCIYVPRTYIPYMCSHLSSNIIHNFYLL